MTPDRIFVPGPPAPSGGLKVFKDQLPLYVVTKFAVVARFKPDPSATVTLKLFGMTRLLTVLIIARPFEPMVTTPVPSALLLPTFSRPAPTETPPVKSLLLLRNNWPELGMMPPTPDS